MCGNKNIKKAFIYWIKDFFCDHTGTKRYLITSRFKLIGHTFITLTFENCKTKQEIFSQTRK